MPYQDLRAFILRCVESSLYVAPTRVGLTRAEIVEIATEAGHGAGEATDALDALIHEEQIEVGEASRYWFAQEMVSADIGYFMERFASDPRNPKAFDFVHSYLSELARAHGAAAANAYEQEILSRAQAAGLAAHDVRVALAALSLGSLALQRDAGGKYTATLGWLQGGTPSTAHRGTSVAKTPHSCASVLPSVEVVLGRRGWGKSATRNASQGESHLMSPATDTLHSCAILFLDVEGWSKLDASHIARFVNVSLPEIDRRLADADMKNSWGDAVVATFPRETDAAVAALEIRDFFVRATDDQLPKGLRVRIALHRGQVLWLNNPVRKSKDIFGHAVHVAARLEPVTPPGAVFCTSEFAQALHDVLGTGPRAHSVGRLTFPKGFGSFDVHEVTWNNENVPKRELELPEYKSEPKAPPPSPL